LCESRLIFCREEEIEPNQPFRHLGFPIALAIRPAQHGGAAGARAYLPAALVNPASFVASCQSDPVGRHWPLL